MKKRNKDFLPNLADVATDNILENMAANLYWKDKEGTYLGCNNSFARLASLKSPIEIIGKNDFMFSWKRNAKIFHDNDSIVLKSGHSHEFEESLTLSDGTDIIVLTSRAPLKDRKGNIIGIIGTSIDITEMKNREMAFSEAKQRAEAERNKAQIYLENILKYLPVNVYWKNKECVILGCNDRLAHYNGLSQASDVIGKTDFELLRTKEQAEAIIKNDLEVMAKNEVTTFEETVAAPEGKTVTFLSIKAPMIDKVNNELLGLVGISIDITDRKEAELELLRQKEKVIAANQAKSYFMASIGHEFRTPLNDIIGLSEILISSIDHITNSERIEYCESIHQAGKNLLDLINDVILFSRMEMGYFKIDEQDVNLEEMILKIIRNSNHRAEEKSLKFEIDYPASIPKIVRGDVQRVRQVLTNLIDNALKFSHEGIITIKVEYPANEEGTLLKVNVTDQGIGIPHDKLDVVFEKFSQVYSEHHDKRMGRYQGIGLGLAIVKQLVELMHGSVGVVSELGKGSNFYFTLPITTTTAVNETSKNVPANIPKKPTNDNATNQTIFSKCKILIVEDNSLAVKFLQILMKKFGCEFEIATKGSEALDLLSKKEFHLVLLDLGLPDINGIEVCKTWRSMEKKSQRVLIYALTAQGVEEGESYALSAGMDGYIEKPINYEKLNAVLTLANEKIK